MVYIPIGVCETFVKFLKRRSNKRNRIFLLNIPSHGNLGDHLISIAEQEFLRDNFPEREVILVSSSELYFSSHIALMGVREDDVLCVTGGGFMGSLYSEEKRFLDIIKRFPNNKIIFFPQTLYYEPTHSGEKQMKIAAKVYSNHTHLYVMARDKNSYELLINRLMPNSKHRVFLCPDIALYVHSPQNNARKGVIWCLRNDLEINKANSSIIQIIRKVLKEKNVLESNTDTYVARSISIENEVIEVEAKMDELSRARFVITDRLHGMIYSIITDTPVIALDNLNHKVNQVYSLWLKDIPFVKILHDSSCVYEVIEEMLSIDNCSYDNTTIRECYKPIIDIINE